MVREFYLTHDAIGAIVLMKLYLFYYALLIELLKCFFEIIFLNLSLLDHKVKFSPIFFYFLKEFFDVLF